MTTFTPTANELLIPVNTVDDQYGSYRAGNIASLANGGYVIVWTCETGATASIRMQRYDSHGVRLGTETTVSTFAGFDIIPTVAVLIATSFLTPHQVRRVSLIVFAVSLALVVATILFGAEIKGARRWIVVLGLNIQPSEFLKPAFVILIAWLFGESARRPEMPSNTIALVLSKLPLK